MTEQSAWLGTLATWVFLPLLVAFSLYVGAGYYFTIMSFAPTLLPALGIVGAVVIMVVIYFFIRHTALALHERRLTPDKGRYWLFTFVALFLFSGYGVLSSSMLFLEGPTVVREVTGETITSLAILDSAAEEFLSVPQYNDMKARILTGQSQLNTEIVNPSPGNFCGIGPKAKDIILRMAIDLPGFTWYAGSDKNFTCSNVSYFEDMKKKYNEIIADHLASSPVALRFKVAERDKVLREIKGSHAEQRRILGELRRGMAGVATFISRFSLYQVAVARLEQAKGVYEANYQKLLVFGPADRIKAPATIDIRVVEDLASSVQVISAIFARLDRVSTWVYLLTAVVADLLISYLASVIITNQRQTRKVAQSSVIRNSDVVYLWRPVR